MNDRNSRMEMWKDLGEFNLQIRGDWLVMGILMRLWGWIKELVCQSEVGSSLICDNVWRSVGLRISKQRGISSHGQINKKLKEEFFVSLTGPWGMKIGGRHGTWLKLNSYPRGNLTTVQSLLKSIHKRWKRNLYVSLKYGVILADLKT